MSHAYEENPLARAHWEGLGRARGTVLQAADEATGAAKPGDGIEDLVELELGWKKVGPMGEGFYGGPIIVFSSPIVYETPAGTKLAPFGAISLFTYTTKMSCPSYSLPAGPIAMTVIREDAGVRMLPSWVPYTPSTRGQKVYGTCPAALRASVDKTDYPLFHAPMHPRSEYICDKCYAGKGRYLYPNMAIKQMAVLAWTQKALKAGVFADAMTEAVRSLQQPAIEEMLATKLTSPWYFRIHDAGDFFSTQYMLAWFEICRRLSNVRFWAPTRMWVFAKFRALFDQAPPNLALRPSALAVDALPPRGAGGDAGTMVNEAVDPWSTPSPTSAFGRIWPCPAYESKSTKSCSNAPRPDDGGIGCRTCWTKKDVEVSYPGH